jgi:hypothetical protein
LAFLENLFGRDVWSEFIKQNPEDLLEIKRKFEAKKRGLTAQPTEATIPYPPSLFKTYIEKRQVKSIQEGIEKSRYSQTIQVIKNKLRFDPEIMKQFFKQTTDSIIAHVKDMLVKSNRHPLTTENMITSLKHSLMGDTFVRMCSRLSYDWTNL